MAPNARSASSQSRAILEPKPAALAFSGGFVVAAKALASGLAFGFFLVLTGRAARGLFQLRNFRS
jgi:hypothetical protein